MHSALSLFVEAVEPPAGLACTSRGKVCIARACAVSTGPLPLFFRRLTRETPQNSRRNRPLQLRHALMYIVEYCFRSRNFVYFSINLFIARFPYLCNCASRTSRFLAHMALRPFTSFYTIMPTLIAI
jgi:hypothetical protein